MYSIKLRRAIAFQSCVLRLQKYIEEYITRWREDMNFICEWQNNILRQAQRVSKMLFLQRENKIQIFKPPCNVLFIIQTKRHR